MTTASGVTYLLANMLWWKKLFKLSFIEIHSSIANRYVNSFAFWNINTLYTENKYIIKTFLIIWRKRTNTASLGSRQIQLPTAWNENIISIVSCYKENVQSHQTTKNVIIYLHIIKFYWYENVRSILLTSTIT